MTELERIVRPDFGVGKQDWLNNNQIKNLPTGLDSEGHIGYVGLGAIYNEKFASLLLQHFRCKHCGTCCGPIIGDGVSVTNVEVAQIANFLHIRKRKITRRLQNGNIKFPCEYLKNNKCSIYPVRPLLCKLYPIIPLNYLPEKGLMEAGIALICESAKDLLIKWIEITSVMYQALQNNKQLEQLHLQLQTRIIKDSQKEYVANAINYEVMRRD